ncbi:putative ribonuclease H-like domain-containing protein [Tanacetum coccineum]
MMSNKNSSPLAPCFQMNISLPLTHMLISNMFIAIKARFGGNDATKKTQKALLKQQYENFNATSSESLDSIFNRLQKLVSRLAILVFDTSPEDLNFTRIILLKHVICDVGNPSVSNKKDEQTSYSELRFLSAIYEGKTHQDLHTCLFACFLSQEEPKRVTKALSDPAWGYGKSKWSTETRNMRGELLSGTKQAVAQAKHKKKDKLTSYFDLPRRSFVMSFEKLMKDKFQMSSMGELTFFLGLQVQQKKKGIFISQDKYVHEILKKFNYTDVKSASTPLIWKGPFVKEADADDLEEHSDKSR